MVIYYFEGAVDGKVSRVVEIFENSVVVHVFGLAY